MGTKKPKIYVPTTGVESWQALLADPEKHWKAGYSAKALACCWEEAKGFSPEIQALLASVPEYGLADTELLMAFPEHKVPLPGGARESQTDLFALGKACDQLVSIAVEGKVSEPFGPTVGEWIANGSVGKHKRLAYLKEMLGLEGNLDPEVRYQLLHRIVSAVIEAERFNASKAVMMVHSFSQSSEWFGDFERFLGLFGVGARIGNMACLRSVCGIEVYSGWAKGADRFLIS